MAPEEARKLVDGLLNRDPDALAKLGRLSRGGGEPDSFAIIYSLYREERRKRHLELVGKTSKREKGTVLKLNPPIPEIRNREPRKPWRSMVFKAKQVKKLIFRNKNSL